PPSPRVSALGDRRNVNALHRQLPTARLVDARDLEESDPRIPELEISPGGLDQAREELAPEERELDADRLLEPKRGSVAVRLDERRRVHLRKAEADEDVLDPAAQALVGGQLPEHLAPHGQRERNVGQPEARDLLDDVDLARDVA